MLEEGLDIGLRVSMPCYRYSVDRFSSSVERSLVPHILSSRPKDSDSGQGLECHFWALLAIFHFHIYQGLNSVLGKNWISQGQVLQCRAAETPSTDFCSSTEWPLILRTLCFNPKTLTVTKALYAFLGTSCNFSFNSFFSCQLDSIPSV